MRFYFFHFLLALCANANAAEKASSYFKFDSTTFESNHLPDHNCKECPVKVVKVINQYENLTIKPNIPKPFSSVGIKCLVCLVTAYHMNETINQTPVQRSNLNFTGAILSQKLFDLCKHGFQNFALREFNGHKLLAPPFSNTVHVSTNMDGQWSKLLRETCWNFFTQFGAIRLYNATQEISQENIGLTKFLCGNGSASRYCRNIQFRQVEVKHFNNHVESMVQL